MQLPAYRGARTYSLSLTFRPIEVNFQRSGNATSGEGKVVRRSVWLVILALAAGGCLAPKAVYKTMNLSEVETGAAFDTTLTVLRKHFQIEQMDRTKGIIETRWREQSHDSGLHSIPMAAARPDKLGEDLMIIRRRAQVQVVGVGKDVRIKLRVLKQREKAQESRENVIFTEYDPMTPSEPHIIDPRPQRRERIWLPLGNDHAAEKELLEKIASGLEVPPEKTTMY